MGIFSKLIKKGVKSTSSGTESLVQRLAKNGIKGSDSPVATTTTLGKGFGKQLGGGRSTNIIPKASSVAKYGVGIGLGGAVAGYGASFGVDQIRNAVAVTQDQRRAEKDNELATERLTILERASSLGSAGEIAEDGVLPYITQGADGEKGMSPLLLLGALGIGGVGAYALLRKKKKR